MYGNARDRDDVIIEKDTTVSYCYKSQCVLAPSHANKHATSQVRTALGVLRLSCFMLFSMVIANVAANVAMASSNTRENVMRALAGVESAVAEFVEVRESGFLTSQLIVKGRISYQSPDKLQRSVAEPYVEEITIDGDTMTLMREKDTTEGESRVVKQRVSLESAPIVRSVVESVRSTLAGDLSRLEELFDIEWQSSTENWTMMLKPIDERLQESITSIELTGNASKIETITTVESDGDESKMTLTYLSGL